MAVGRCVKEDRDVVQHEARSAEDGRDALRCSAFARLDRNRVFWAEDVLNRLDFDRWESDSKLEVVVTDGRDGVLRADVVAEQVV